MYEWFKKIVGNIVFAVVFGGVVLGGGFLLMDKYEPTTETGVEQYEYLDAINEQLGRVEDQLGRIESVEAGVSRIEERVESIERGQQYSKDVTTGIGIISDENDRIIRELQRRAGESEEE